jgi:hypothetical protein
MSKHDAVVPEVAQALAGNQLIHGLPGRPLTSSGPDTVSACCARALRMRDRSRCPAFIVPSAVCHHCMAISISVRGAGSAAAWPAKRPSR